MEHVSGILEMRNSCEQRPIQAKHMKLGIDEEALAKADYEKHPYATSVRLRDPVSKKSLLIVCCLLRPT